MIIMAFIDRILLRNPEETARAEATREFRRLMPMGGRFSEFAESGITSYYDRRFGAFEPRLDEWRGGAQIIQANPQLRRVDVIADALFGSGSFRVSGIGPVVSRSDPLSVEGVIAVVGIRDRPGIMMGMLTLDIGSEIRFTKLRVGIEGRGDWVVRPSSLDLGMAISQNPAVPRDLPETVSDKAPQWSIIVQTIGEAIAAIEGLLRGRSP